MTLTHTCISQLRLSLRGPGPATSSPNYDAPSPDYEVRLLDRPYFASGCIPGSHTLTFDDSSTIYLRSRSDPPADLLTGVYHPEGSLSDFSGQSPYSTWTLVVEDMFANGNHSGTVDFWRVNFTVTDCTPVYVWSNLTDTLASGGPVARYASQAMTYQSSIFVLGGRDQYDSVLYDLYRYDVHTAVWTALTPVAFEKAWSLLSSYGTSVMLTPAGLMAYSGSGGDGQVQLMDVVSGTWQVINTTLPQPAPRFWASAVYIPSSYVQYLTKFDVQTLYGISRDNLPSGEINKIGSLADSVVIFGGFYDVSGSVWDGSSGGLLNDMWMLRLPQYSTPSARTDLYACQSNHCTFRKLGMYNNTTNNNMTTLLDASGNGGYSILNGESYSPCLQVGGAGSECSFDELLLLIWCDFTIPII